MERKYKLIILCVSIVLLITLLCGCGQSKVLNKTVYLEELEEEDINLEELQWKFETDAMDWENRKKSKKNMTLNNGEYMVYQLGNVDGKETIHIRMDIEANSHHNHIAFGFVQNQDPKDEIEHQESLSMRTCVLLVEDQLVLDVRVEKEENIALVIFGSTADQFLIEDLEITQLKVEG